MLHYSIVYAYNVYDIVHSYCMGDVEGCSTQPVIHCYTRQQTVPPVFVAFTNVVLTI